MHVNECRRFVIRKLLFWTYNISYECKLLALKRLVDTCSLGNGRDKSMRTLPEEGTSIAWPWRWITVVFPIAPVLTTRFSCRTKRSSENWSTDAIWTGGKSVGYVVCLGQALMRPFLTCSQRIPHSRCWFECVGTLLDTKRALYWNVHLLVFIH